MDGAQTRSNVPSYLAWSICNALCCCLPLGIAAIVFSSRAIDANSAGDWSRAQEASRTAKKLNIIGIVCGIVLLIIFVVLAVALKKT